MRKHRKLKEWKDLYQRPGERRRRCFTNGTFEIYVWYGPGGVVASVQLLYLLDDDPMRALLWDKERGTRRFDVESGEADGLTYNTGRAFGMPSGPFEKEAVFRRLKQDSGGLETKLRGLLIKIVSEFVDSEEEA